MLDTYIKFFAAHEKPILAVILAFALWGGIERINTLIVNHDKAQQTAQAQIIAADIAKNVAVAQQVATDQATMKQMQATANAREAALEAQVVNVLIQLASQQKQDAAMTPTQLTDRWNVLVPSAKATVSPSGEIALPSEGAVATVQQLELVPVQQQELSAAQQTIELKDGLLVQSQKTNLDLTSEVTGLKVTAVDTAKKCEDDKKVLKAEARKSKSRWFIVGFITGFGLRQYIKSSLGI